MPATEDQVKISAAELRFQAQKLDIIAKDSVVSKAYRAVADELDSPGVDFQGGRVTFNSEQAHPWTWEGMTILGNSVFRYSSLSSLLVSRGTATPEEYAKLYKLDPSNA